ncbi:MAG: hypothetical protein HOP02_03150 [Methylococcaceae bacterium]|nr:hypothetical protein [Methylococcaceae bacterium]
MKRLHTPAHLNPRSQLELFKQTAFHEAGHAVAIYLRNQQIQLPPVFFQITLDAYEPKPLENKYLAKVEGGHLIENLPFSLTSLPEQQQSGYLAAFEADIVNLLAGPLAEAKYIALRDDEVINRDIVNLNALAFYGGASDLERVEAYIQCFIENMQQRIDKVDALFSVAFDFINTRTHWKIITDLALHIITCQKNTIPCEEIINIIEQSLLRVSLGH